MATGQITTFPIQTIFEFASETTHGICNVLESEIKPLTQASKITTGSEQAIREALDNINPEISYESLGTLPAIEIAETFSAGAIMFRSLNANTGISITTSSTSIDLAASGPHLGGADLDILGTMSVQGGSLQISKTISYSDFVSDSFYTRKYLFGVFPANTCISKTFIKCFIPFDVSGCSFSFGIEGERDRWIAQSRVPTAAGLYENWSYGLGLSEERDILDVETTAYIYIYSALPTGIIESLPTVGQFGVSVFYDSIVWPS